MSSNAKEYGKEHMKKDIQKLVFLEMILLTKICLGYDYTRGLFTMYFSTFYSRWIQIFPDG